MTADIPGSIESVNLVALFKYKQVNAAGESTVPEIVSFDDPTLLAAIDYRQHDNEAYGVVGNTVIFDNEVFNQDVFITNKDMLVGAKINYYLELEQFKLDISEASVATLKDMRGS